MNNICEGKDFETFGSFKIELSCKFDELSQNGSYLVFTDMAMKTSFLKKASFDEHYIYDYEILSVTHRLISRFMLSFFVLCDLIIVFFLNISIYEEWKSY